MDLSSRPAEFSHAVITRIDETVNIIKIYRPSEEPSHDESIHLFHYSELFRKIQAK